MSDSRILLDGRVRFAARESSPLASRSAADTRFAPSEGIEGNALRYRDALQVVRTCCRAGRGGPAERVRWSLSESAWEFGQGRVNFIIFSLIAGMLTRIPSAPLSDSPSPRLP